MNIYYIRAAIQSALGIEITLEQTKQALIAEGMVSKKNADKLIFIGYGDYYDNYTPVVEDDYDTSIPPIIEDDAKQSIEIALNGVL